MTRTPRAVCADAFTLVELLITIAIIGVLIAILVPVIHKVQTAAKGASTSAQLTAIATAIQAYYGDFKAYPGPLSNTQVGAGFFTNIVPTPTPQIPDPSNPGNTLELKFTPSLSSFPVGVKGPEVQWITGSENLVLGLLGGLELHVTSGVVDGWDYNPLLIFPDGIKPAPIGASNLSIARPKRRPVYLQTSPGDLSPNDLSPTTSMNKGQFMDSANRTAQDSVIPEFLDKFSEPMPILYIRQNVGVTPIASFGGMDDAKANLTGQYDLSQVAGYTQNPTAPAGAIGTVINSPTRNHHGLQGLGDPNLGDTIASGWANMTNPGFNGLAYLKDPSNPGTTNATGNARQKNGFILISAGPDGIYGTSDDIIYPGTLNP